MPPSKIKFNVSGLLNLMQEETDEILQRVDQPLASAKDKKSGKLYLLCDYNRDGDSYRSPWTNEYDPALPDGFMPSDRLRAIEEKANLVFDSYRALYYEGGCVRGGGRALG
jgi:capping protein beta